MALTSDDFVSVWECNEASGNFLDALGPNLLTAFNSPGSTTGKVGNARTFNGSNTYATNTWSPSTRMGDFNFTMGCWVYLNSTSVTQLIFGRWQAPNEYSLSYDQPTNRFRFAVRDSAGSTLFAVGSNNHGAVSINTWYFLVGYHDADGNVIKISVNNGTPDSSSWSSGVYSGNAPMTFGRSDAGPAGYVNARIDQAWIARRLLDSTDLAVIYNAGSGGAFPWGDNECLVALLGYWPLSEASGTRSPAHYRGSALTASGTVGSTTGLITSAANFTASGSYLTNDDLNMRCPYGGYGSFTIQAWVKLSANTGGTIFGRWGGDTGSNEYLLAYNQGTQTFDLIVQESSASDNFMVSSGTVSTGVWYCVHAWYDYAAGQIGICINNGTPNTTANTLGVYSGSEATLKLGGGAGNVNAAICEVGFWGRALPAGVRALLYNAGLGGDPYPFDGSGSGGNSDSSSDLPPTGSKLPILLHNYRQKGIAA